MRLWRVSNMFFFVIVCSCSNLFVVMIFLMLFFKCMFLWVLFLFIFVWVFFARFCIWIFFELIFLVKFFIFVIYCGILLVFLFFLCLLCLCFEFVFFLCIGIVFCWVEIFFVDDLIGVRTVTRTFRTRNVFTVGCFCMSLLLLFGSFVLLFGK